MIEGRRDLLLDVMHHQSLVKNVSWPEPGAANNNFKKQWRRTSLVLLVEKEEKITKKERKTCQSRLEKSMDNTKI